MAIGPDRHRPRLGARVNPGQVCGERADVGVVGAEPDVAIGPDGEQLAPDDAEAVVQRPVTVDEHLARSGIDVQGRLARRDDVHADIGAGNLAERGPGPRSRARPTAGEEEDLMVRAAKQPMNGACAVPARQGPGVGDAVARSEPQPLASRAAVVLDDR